MVHPTTSTKIPLPFKFNLLLPQPKISHKSNKVINASSNLNSNPLHSPPPMKLNSLFLPPSIHISPASSSSSSLPRIFKPKSSLSKLSPSTSPLLPTVRPHKLTSRTRKNSNGLTYYAGLASKLAQNGKFQDFLLIAETVVGSGVRVEEFVGLVNVELFSKGVVRIVGDGGVGRVIEVLKGVEKIGIPALGLFDGAAVATIGRELGRMVECGRVEEVVDLMEMLAGSHFSIEELVKPSAVIRLCVKKRKPHAAIRYACFSPITDILFSTIILEFSKKKDLVSAMTVFEASKQNLGYNMYILRTIIDVCGLCGHHLRSRSIYEELLAQNITPNIHVFNSLMNVNARDLSYTTNIFKHMKNLGMFNMATYNILLKSCCLAARVDLAQDIYREIQHLESNGLLKLDVFTYSTLIKVFTDAKMWIPALEIKETMLEAGIKPNMVTWSSLINACAGAGLVDQAFKLFDEMVCAGCVPNTQCCNTLLQACVEACQYDRAFRLFQSWMSHGKIDGNENDAPGGRKLVSNSRGMQFMGFQFKPSTSTYNILMKACGTDLQRAKALMSDMSTVGVSPNEISWCTLINIAGSSGNVESAIQILRTMNAAGFQPCVIAYNGAIKVCVENKCLEEAFSLFNEMKRYQIQPSRATYNTLLRARSKYGSVEEVQQCLSLYQEMRRAGYKANDYYLKKLIEEWCEGILKVDRKHQGLLRSSNRSDSWAPPSLLLESVATHLQKHDSEALSVDLRGLTKVEARIVVLAVLRMIKENYTPGDTFRDDMFIILGSHETHSAAAERRYDVANEITKLLRDDLGLEVLPTGQAMTTKRTENSFGPQPNLEEIVGTNGLSPTQLGYPSRRPAGIRRLQVTKSSLHRWLRKRSSRAKREILQLD